MIGGMLVAALDAIMRLEVGGRRRAQVETQSRCCSWNSIQKNWRGEEQHQWGRRCQHWQTMHSNFQCNRLGSAKTGRIREKKQNGNGKQFVQADWGEVGRGRRGVLKSKPVCRPKFQKLHGVLSIISRCYLAKWREQEMSGRKTELWTVQGCVQQSYQ